MPRSNLQRSVILGAALLLALACSTDSPTEPVQTPGPPVDLGDPLVVASFTAAAGIDDLTFTFTNESTGATDYSWDFGDGEQSTLVNPIHSYLEPGTYTVALTASNPSFFDVAEQFVDAGTPIVDDPVVANFASTTSTDNLVAIFDDTSTGEPTSYTWKFGDGKRSSQMNPVHEYDVAGTYTVTLEVSDAISSDDVSHFVTVPNGGIPDDVPVIADFAVTTSADNLIALFADASSGAPTKYKWDFGDGTTSKEQNPVHEYAVAGTYTVTLEVSDAVSSDDTSQFVTVPADAG